MEGRSGVRKCLKRNCRGFGVYVEKRGDDKRVEERWGEMRLFVRNKQVEKMGRKIEEGGCGIYLLYLVTRGAGGFGLH